MPTGGRDDSKTNLRKEGPDSAFFLLSRFQVSKFQVSRFQTSKAKDSKVPVVRVHGLPIVHHIDMVSLKLPIISTSKMKPMSQ
jgi:hypothetical protein